MEASELGIHAYATKELPVKPITVEIQVSGKTLTMEADTGAAVPIISETVFWKKFPGTRLKPSLLVLKTYTKEPMKVVGTFPVEVCYQKQESSDLELVVVAGGGRAS